MHSPILLISTDFDGTLVEHGNPTPYSPLLLEVLHALRGRGVRWAINTGRTLPQLVEAFQVFGWPVRPDFALTSEREVFRPSGSGNDAWEDFGHWNETCARAHRELFAQAAPLFREMLNFIHRETEARELYGYHVRGQEGEAELAGLVAHDDSEMDKIVSFLETLRPRLPDLNYQRNTIYLRFCHAAYDKGATLSELGRLIGVNAESIFAVGDHHNDISMLDGVHARHVACPANSVDAVKEVVRAASGYVASAPYSAGVIEALRFYCQDLAV